MSKSRYEILGASASKSGLHNALKQAGISEQSGLFAGLNTDLAGDPDYSCFLHCDGAGTKSIVAYLLWKETGSVDAFAGLAQDALVMNIDDIFCVGAPQSLLLSNLIARNTKLIGDDILAVIIRRYKELIAELSDSGIPIELGGGETADCGDVVRTLLVDAVLAGRIAKANIINANSIAAGDCIVGLSSTGKAKYEKCENSSIGSNGLTLARHALLNKELTKKYPEIVDPEVDSESAYCGPFSVTCQPEQLGTSVGNALLSPTRTYAPVLAKIYKELTTEVHAAIHCTGGGQTKILRFGKGMRYVKDNLFDTPPLFALIQKQGQVDWREMYQVFNMGHRMELYVTENQVDQIIDIAAEFNINAQRIGFVEKNDSDDNTVNIRTVHGDFDYELS